jgi:hypothetical protein
MAREVQTAVQIANMALRVLQASPIESFDEETVPAVTVRMYYDVVLRKCLGRYHWAFCTRERELAQLPKSPLEEWEFAHRLPPDFVAMGQIRPGSGRGVGPVSAALNDYEIVGGNILCCNVPGPLLCRYTYDAPVELYPDYFIDLLVDSLVEELAAVLGHNLDAQRIFQGRVFGPYGKLGVAIQRELAEQGSRRCPRRMSRLAAGRIW